MSNSNISGESLTSWSETANKYLKLLLSKEYKYFKSESRMSGRITVGDNKYCHSKQIGTNRDC